MNSKSPLLVGYKTNTPLDLITYRLFFIFPLSEKQVEWLNTVIYQDNLFLINYWSLTHTLFGILWGLMNSLVNNQIFSGRNYLLFHTAFELWELYAVHMQTQQFTKQEFIDCVMDTVFGYIGFLIGRNLGIAINTK